MNGQPIFFTLNETVALLGFAQSLLLLLYMMLRAGRITYAAIPCLYFLVLAVAFAGDVAARFLADGLRPGMFSIIQVTLWFATVPLSLLVIRQVAQVITLPRWPHFFWILSVPIVAFAGFGALGAQGAALAAVVMGSIGLLSLWDTRAHFAALGDSKMSGPERYWLCLSLVLLNVVLLVLLAGGELRPEGVLSSNTLARDVLGLTFIYVVSTCLFRIYPQVVKLRGDASDELSDAEQIIAKRIENLLDLDKVYQEPSYGRADLARELNLPEAQLSRLINVHFNKTLPQILNERRVADATRLLRETDAPVKVIADQVGFNSLATFNRVFKDMTGQNPTEFRVLAQNDPDVRRSGAA